MASFETRFEPNLTAAWAQTQQSMRGREHIEEPQNFYKEWTFDISKILSSRAWAVMAAKAVWDHPAAQSCTWLQVTGQASLFARQVARALNCNEELAESCVMVLNLGRTPGAYEGWRAISWMMSPLGGFDPHLQALRMIDELEIIHPEYNGLNLTFETREVLLHACSKNAGSLQTVLGFTPLQPSLEASIAFQSQRLAMLILALSTSLHNGLIFPENLRHLSLWRTSENHISRFYKRLEDRRRIPLAIAHMRDALLMDLIKNSRRVIENDPPSSTDAVRRSEKKYISQSGPFSEEILSFESLLHTILNHDTQRLQSRQRRISDLCALLLLLQNNTTLLGPYAHQRLRKETPLRVICDFFCYFNDEQLQRMSSELLFQKTQLTSIQPTLFLE